MIIPVYNGEKTLERAVGSVFSHVPDFTELIIVDDGSTDGTADLCEQLRDQYGGKVVCVRQENQGPAAARNHGMRLARGEWLWLLDCDDEIAPGAGGRVRELLARHPDAGVVVGAYDSISGGERHKQLQGKLASAPVERLRDFLIRKKLRPVHGAVVVHKRMRGEMVYPEDMPQSEDIPVFARLVMSPETVVTDAVLAVLHRSPGSLRNDATHVQSNIDRLVDGVFGIPNLPPAAAALRPEYMAGRCLSAARILRRAGRKKSARQCFWKAVRARPPVLFRLRSLRFLLRAYLP